MTVHVHTWSRFGPPRGDAALQVCMCGHWTLDAGGYHAEGGDALREVTAALALGAGHVTAATALEMRNMAKMLRGSGTGWQ